jgi:streptomycin 6-kinase
MLIMEDVTDNEPLPDAGEDDTEIIAQALQMLKELDNTPLTEMTPLFYQHWFEQLNMATRDLLRILGHDPGA